MAHLNKFCPEYCKMDSSDPIERTNACGLCFRNPTVDTRMNFGKDLAGNEYTGTIEPDGSMKTWVNGRLVVKKC